MNYKIIHTLLPAMIIGMAWATASCTSDPEPDSLERGQEMVFEVLGTASRSTVSTNSNLTKQPFILFGDVIRTGEHNPGKNVIFNGEKVSYINKKWSYKNPLYWLMSQEHSFVAVHPYLEPGAEISDITYSDSKLSFTYTVPKNDDGITDYDEMKDILFATHRRKYNLDNADAVKLSFQHLMAQINIEPALTDTLMYPDETDKNKYPYNENEFIQIKQFELYGLKTRASFSFTSKPLPTTGALQTSAYEVTYQVDDNSMSHAVMSFDGEVKVTNNGINVNICKDDDTMLVLPQKIDESAIIVLYYTINTDHQKGDLIRKITFPLSGLPIKEWEVGKIYTYKFIINKAYTGQIKPGSIEWEVNDRTIPDDNNKNWIGGGGTIKQVFNADEDQQNQDENQ